MGEELRFIFSFRVRGREASKSGSQQMDQNITHRELEGAPSDLLEAFMVLEDEVEGSAELASRTLVGKILSKKILNKGAVRAICCCSGGSCEGKSL